MKKLKDILFIGMGIVALAFFVLLFKDPALLQSILYFFGISYTISYYIINTMIFIFGGGALIFFLSMLLLFVFRYYQKRIFQARAEKLLENDKRKPILILRPFKDDNLRIFPIKYAGETHIDIESVLVSRLSDYGPVIAIGKPNEAIQPLGASRLYVDDTWKEKVEILIRESSLIVLMVDFTPGVKWEIETVLKNYKEKVIIIPKIHSMLINNIIGLVDAIPLIVFDLVFAKPLKLIFNKYRFFKKLRRSFFYYKQWNKVFNEEFDENSPLINDRTSAVSFTDNKFITYHSENPTLTSQVNAILGALNEKLEKLCGSEESSLDIQSLKSSVTSTKDDEIDFASFNLQQKIAFAWTKVNKRGLIRSLIKVAVLIIVIAGVFFVDYKIHDKLVTVENKSYSIQFYEYELEGHYYGDWKNKKPNGTGTFFTDTNIDDLQLSTGDYFVGDWLNGKLVNCEVVYATTNTILYRGALKDGLPDGLGMIVLDDIGYYGNFINGDMYGEFTVYESNKEPYTITLTDTK